MAEPWYIHPPHPRFPLIINLGLVFFINVTKIVRWIKQNSSQPWKRDLGGRNFTTFFHVTIGIKIYSNSHTFFHFITFRRKKGWRLERGRKNVTVIIYLPPPTRFQLSIFNWSFTRGKYFFVLDLYLRFQFLSVNSINLCAYHLLQEYKLSLLKKNKIRQL